MEQDAQEAIAAEKDWLKAGGDRGGQPDQGYNQWISFNFKFEDFPKNYCLALKSMDDVDIHCGKLFVGNKDIELEPGFCPFLFFPERQHRIPDWVPADVIVLPWEPWERLFCGSKLTKA